MPSPNPAAQRPIAVEYVKNALDKLEHAEHELVADENRALREELERLIFQLKMLKEKLKP